MNFEDKEAIQDKINIIARQTDYDNEIAYKKLQEADGDHIKVIKNYMGITEKKAPTIKSVNQEIYRQLRHKMDDSLREYNKKQQEKLEKEISENMNL